MADNSDKESVSSFGGSEVDAQSQASTASSKNFEENWNDDSADDFLGNRTGYQDSLFGILHPLSKSRYTNLRKYAVALVILDFLQLSVLFVKPMNHGWDIDYTNPIWDNWNKLQLQNPAADQSYTAWLILMYVVVIAIAAAGGIMLVLGGYIKNGAVKSGIPIHALRAIISIAFAALFVSCYKILVTAFDCHLKKKVDDGVAAIPVGMNRMFPEEDCTAMPHVVHAGLGLIGAVLLSIGAYFFAWLDVDSNPDSRNLLATSSVHMSVALIKVKIFVGVLPAILAWHNKLATFLMLVAFAYAFMTVLKHAPYYSAPMNSVYAAMYALLLWAALITQVAAWQHNDRDALTTVLFAGAIPAALGGWLAMRFRMMRPRRLAVRFAADLSLAYSMDQFKNAEEVEIASRCMRVKDDGEPVEQLVDAAEALLRCGIAQFPDSAFLQVVQANFMIEMRGKFSEGQRGLEHARRLRMSMAEKFQVYARLEQLKEGAMISPSSAEGNASVVNYTEFEAHYNMLCQVHMSAMRAVRRFWRELSDRKVRFRKLEEVLGRMAKAEQRAMQTYRTMLEHYPKSVKVIRAYGRFLEDVRNDPAAASRYFTEAERLEDELAEAHREAQIASLAQMGGESGSAGANMSQQILDDDHPEAIMVITRFGIVQIVNKKANSILGYNKSELVGKNISEIMPAPFSTMHNSFLRNYCRSGIPRILDSTREVVAMHKDLNIFPVNIVVSVVDYNGEDHFMGILQPKAEDPTTSVLYCTAEGVVLCANRVFTDMFGFVAMDVVGKNVCDFCQEAEPIQEAMVRVLDMYSVSEDDNELRTKATVVHAYDLPIASDLLIRVGGTANHKILIFEFSQEGGLGGICTFQTSGKVKDYNRAFAEMTGYRHGELSNGDLSMVMPPGYALLHTRYMKNLEPAPDGCKLGRLVELAGKGNVKVPARLQVVERRKGKSGAKLFAVMCKPAPREEIVGEHLLTITMHFNGLIASVDSGFESLGLDHAVYQPEQLHGMPISNLVHICDDRLAFQHGPDAMSAEDPTVWLQPIITHMMEENRRGPLNAWRASLRPSPALPPIPAMVVLSQESGAQGMVTASIYRADRVEGLMVVNENMFVVEGDPRIAYLAGLLPRQLEDVALNAVMPAVAPTGQPSELLGAAVKGGGTKKKIVVGPKRQATFVHQDGTAIPVHIEVAMQPKDRRAGVPMTKFHMRLITAAGTAGDMFDPAKPWGNPNAVRRTNNASANQANPNGAEVVAEKKSKPTKARGVRFGGADEEEDDDDDTKALVPKTREPLDDSKFMGLVDSASAAEQSKALVPVGDDGASSADASESEMTSEGGDNDGRGGGGNSFHMAKRLKKIMKLLKAQQAKSGMMKMRGLIRRILLLIIVVHAGCFAGLRVLVDGYKSQVGKVNDAGVSVVAAMDINIAARLILSAATNTSGTHPSSILPEQIASINTLATQLEDIQHALFLDSGGSLSADLSSLYESPALLSKQLDTSTGVDELREVRRGLWELTNTYIASAREVGTDFHNHAGARASPPWVYVTENGPWVLVDGLRRAADLFTDAANDHLDLLCVVIIVLLVVEAAVVAPVCLVFLATLLRRVAAERLQLFSVFLMVPKPTLVALASRDISRKAIDDEGTREGEGGGQQGEEEDEDLGGGGGGVGSGGGGGETSGATIKFNAARGRTMENYSLDVYLLAAPLVVWMGGLAALYVVSYGAYKASSHDIVNLNAAEAVRYYAERARFFSLELVLSSAAAAVTANRAEVSSAVRDIEEQMDGLLYGTAASLPDMGGALRGSSSHQFYMFEERGCLRKDQSRCYTEADDYYVHTRHGLEPMLKYYQEQAHLLTTDPTPALGLQNPRFDYIWQVGGEDLYDGLETSAGLFRSDTSASVDTESMLSALVLCVLVIGSILYYNFMFKPFVARGTAQMRRVAELLTQLPEEIDVVAMVQSAGMGRGVDVNAPDPVPAPPGRPQGMMGSMMAGIRRVAPMDDGAGGYGASRNAVAKKYGV